MSLEITLSKKFRFESAHRLAHGYKGKCSNIHGHSWNGCITLTFDKVDDKGMSVDYSHLKDFCKIVEYRFDHAIILSEADEILPTILECASTFMLDGSVVVLPDNPTSENLAQDILYGAEEYFTELYGTKKIPHKPLSYSVTIEETCTSSCIVTQ